MVTRKIPGKAKETFSYDSGGRLILSQDGNQYANNRYTQFVKGKYILTTIRANRPPTSQIPFSDPNNEYFDSAGYPHSKYLIATYTIPGSNPILSDKQSYYYIPDDAAHNQIINATVKLQDKTDPVHAVVTALPAAYTGEIQAGCHERYKPVLNKYLKHPFSIFGGEPKLSAAELAAIDPEGKYFKNGVVREEFNMNKSDIQLSEGKFYYIPADMADIVNTAINHPNNRGYFSYPTILPGFFIGKVESGVWYFMGYLSQMPWEVDYDEETEPVYTKDVTFAYDHRGRLLSETTTLNDSEPATTVYGYDELGKLKSKSYAGYLELSVPTMSYVVIQYTNSRPDGNSDLHKLLSWKMKDFGVHEWDSWQYMDVNNNINPAFYIPQETERLEPHFLDPDYSLYLFPDCIDIHILSYIIMYLEAMGQIEPDTFRVMLTGFEGGTTVQYAGKTFFTEEYDYNIQGWLTGQSSDLFDLKLGYYDPYTCSVSRSYTGNIVQATWQHKNPKSYDSSVKRYDYKYDGFSRLATSEVFYGIEETNSHSVNVYSEAGRHVKLPGNTIAPSLIPYDRNGNIQRLSRRRGFSPQEDLTYGYTGNQLTSVYVEGSSAGSPYTAAFTYDANGNMTLDGMKKLKFKYNSLNLVESVAGSVDSSERANYQWLADGSKIQVTDGSGKGYRYLGSIVLSRQGGQDEADWELESTGFSGGRIIASKGVSGTGSEITVYTPYYRVTDHLGSIRAVFTHDGTGGLDVVAQNDYYAFGRQHPDGSLAAGNDTQNRYLYNGKESQTTGGLGLLDYGARMYNSDLGRWFSIDPLAEKYYPWSPYNYCMNNPIRYIDPGGKEIKLAGTMAERQTILTHLQRLTNDKLSMRTDGTVIIVRMGGENSGKYLKAGSELIRDLNKKGDGAKTVTISVGSGENSMTELNPANAINGVGSDTTVNFDPSANPSILTKDPTTGNVSGATRPNEIGLGHELIHVDRAMKGVAVDYSIQATHTYKDANGNTVTQTTHKDELETIGLQGSHKYNENKLRKEHGLNERGAY